MAARPWSAAGLRDFKRELLVTLRLWPDVPIRRRPWDGTGGTRLFSENATGVDLCIFRQEDDSQ